MFNLTIATFSYITYSRNPQIGQTVLSDHHYVVAASIFVDHQLCLGLDYMLANNIIAAISCKCKSIKFINSRLLSDKNWQLRDN